MKLKTSNIQLRGQKVNVPFSGIVEVDEKGVIDVDEKTAEFLNENTKWEIFEDSSDVDKGELKKELLKKKIEDLHEIAETAGLNKEDYSKLKKVELIEFLLEKMQ